MRTTTLFIIALIIALLLLARHEKETHGELQDDSGLFEEKKDREPQSVSFDMPDIVEDENLSQLEREEKQRHEIEWDCLMRDDSECEAAKPYWILPDHFELFGRFDPDKTPFVLAEEAAGFKRAMNFSSEAVYVVETASLNETKEPCTHEVLYSIDKENHALRIQTYCQKKCFNEYRKPDSEDPWSVHCQKPYTERFMYDSYFVVHSDRSGADFDFVMAVPGFPEETLFTERYLK